MASSTLIGTAPDQVPTNGDLGDLAFQNKESVEFLGGRGALESFDINAISKEISATAVDIFVYDTSKDSDGGAWRNRCQHLSWYNEPLNTATRGGRKEFPAVAVIVAEANRVTIYDGDSPDLPMWMVFINSQSTSTTWAEWHLSAYTPNKRVVMHNAILNVASRAQYSDWTWAEGLRTISFLGDCAFKSIVMKSIHNIANRNTASSTTSSWPSSLELGNVAPLSRAFVNDVDMKVLPGAPIDPVTKLPIPTIAVATDAGVSIIRDNRSVSSWYYYTGYLYTGRVKFTEDNALLVNHTANTGGTWNNMLTRINIPEGNSSGIAGVTSFLSVYYDSNGSKYLPALTTVPDYWSITENAIGGSQGLTLTAAEPANWLSGMYTYITKNYNTGWMNGDIRGSWLSDTASELLSGPNLIVNPNGDSTTGWFPGSGNTLTTTGSYLKSVSSTGDAAYFGQGVEVIAGKTYKIVVTTIADGTSKPARTYLGSSVGSGDILAGPSGFINGTTTFYYTANATRTVYLWFYGNAGGSGTYILVDSASFTLVDSDRSVKGKGLDIAGTITKTPVAAGADLVAYSNFSSTNYLTQAYNSDLDFGTGDFCIVGWAKWNGNTTYDFFTRQAPSGSGYGTGAGFYLKLSSGGDLSVGLNAEGSGSWPSNTVSIDSSYITQWTQICVVRRNGVIYVYKDGVYKGSGANATNISSSGNSKLFVGAIMYDNAMTGFAGSLALWRISATAPSEAQILKMYNDEKHLFKDNAKATLYGSSNSVTALAHDKYTNLLHVGTSNGRSVFQGLCRVDNTTEAVGAAISAYNGMIAED